MKIFFLASFQILLISLFFVFATTDSAYNIRITEEFEESANDSCYACPEGTFSNHNQHLTNCTEFCPEGFCPRNMTCVPCKPGSFNNQLNATSCTICPPGFFAPVSGSWNCSECPAGTSNNSLNTGCDSCPGGYHSGPGASTCDPCGAGAFAPSGSEFCVPCPRGTYSSSEEASRCTDCGTGKWNPELGSNSSQACLECPVGYYCPSSDTGNPKLCPEGHYCPSGARAPTGCFPLFRSDAGQGKCSPTKYLWIVVGGAGLLLVLLLLVVVGVRSRKKQDKIQLGSRRRIETQRLIPNEGQTPSYTGL